MQNYFGMVIHHNNQVYQMKKAIGAVLFHCSEAASDEQRHRFCSRTSDKCEEWQSDKILEKTTYKPKVTLPIAIRDELSPVFKELSHDSLLKECLHGMTQNVNECINSLIGAQCPKLTYSSRKVLSIGTYSAIISFNDGISGIKKYLTVCIWIMVNSLFKARIK